MVWGGAADGCLGGGKTGPVLRGGVTLPFTLVEPGKGREGERGVWGGEEKDGRLVVDAAGEGGTDPPSFGKRSG